MGEAKGQVGGGLRWAWCATDIDMAKINKANSTRANSGWPSSLLLFGLWI